MSIQAQTASYQAVLPFFPASAPIGRQDADAATIRQRAGVEYRELRNRDILHRCAHPWMPFQWRLEPYRGCEFAYTYLLSRPNHRLFDLHRWQGFEQKISVHQDAARMLRRQLRRRSLHTPRHRTTAIALGIGADPYQPAEQQYRITRSLLEIFTELEGLNLSIFTKSPLIARDLDLLTELDHKHAVSVQISLPSADPVLARRIERHAPDPRARLRTVAKLAREGISTTVACAPLMPAINSTEAQLRPLFEAAREAGAVDVVTEELPLDSSSRPGFLPWLTEEFPHLGHRYRNLYTWRDHLKSGQRDILFAAYRQLRLEYGFPRAMPGRG